MNIPRQRANSAFLDWLDSARPDRPRLTAWLRALLRIVVITCLEFRRNDLSLRSAALTFTILLSLVPILAMSTALVKGLGGDNHLKQAAYGYIATLEEQAIAGDQTAAGAITEATLTGHLRSAAGKIFDYVDQTNFATLGTIGTLALFLSVMLVLSHIETAMNIIWHVKDGRSFIRKISDYITLLVLMPLAINIGFAGSAFLKNPTLSAKLKALIPLLWLQMLLLKMVPVFLIALTLYVIYIFFPNTRVKSLPAFIGALLAAILWFAVQNLCISLQIGVSNYNAIYGSFATLPLLLIWIYFVWIFILTGAQFAYAVQNRESHRIIPTPSTPAQKLAGAFAIMTEIYKGFEQKVPPTPDALETNLADFNPVCIREIILQLADAGLLHVSSTTGQILPATSAENITPALLIGIFMHDGSATADRS
jgi:membrane protein